MGNERHLLTFGPAYLDVVVAVDRPLILDNSMLHLDQSLPATRAVARTDDMLVLEGTMGDRLLFPLPAEASAAAATVYLAEPVLARLLGATTRETVTGEYPVTSVRTQLGGMGAGYAKALAATLCMPLGRDAVGEQILQQLAMHDIHAVPRYLDCPTDTSLVILSPHGDKLAVGVREAMVRWRADARDHALAAEAAGLVFCGAPNALATDLLAHVPPHLPVLYAPPMRNVLDRDCPLAALAPRIHYLTMNALEWEHLDGKARCRELIPVITVTDGPHGSRILLGDEELCIPAMPCDGDVNTNRAGETYGATFFKVLLREAPNVFRDRRLDQNLARRAGQIATRLATRQLRMAGFAFPPDDWMA